MRTRGISPEFINDLKDDKAPLNWIYKRVMSTNSVFSIEIRDEYINIYYRGGSLMKITENQPHNYTFKFDVKYGERKVGHERLDIVIHIFRYMGYGYLSYSHNNIFAKCA